MKFNRIVSSLIMANLMAFGINGYANAATDQKSQTEQIVHDYIIKNPEVVIQSLQGYQEKQMTQARKSMEKTQQTASKFADALFHQANDPMAGNANGKITVVEFFDYQCPHCVDMVPVMQGIVKTNPDVRIIYKEFPIRGPSSEAASKAALAANKQGKYLEFHDALMKVSKSPLTEEVIITTAKSVGLDVDKLKADMKSSAVDQQIKATYKLAQDLQLMGTPALFVAKTDVAKNSGPDAVIFIPGQVNQDQLQEVITKINK